MELKSRSIRCRKTRLDPGLWSAGVLTTRHGSSWREQETYPLWGSVIKHRATCRDETERSTYSVLIFVINLTDQTTKMERHTPFQELMKTIRTRFRKEWPDSSDMMVVFEKMEQSSGESCYVCFIPYTMKWISGRGKHGWITEIQGARRKDFSTAWAPTVTFFTCVPFKASLVETKLIYLCRKMSTSRTLRLNTFITLVLRSPAILLFNHVWLLEEKLERQTATRTTASCRAYGG